MRYSLILLCFILSSADINAQTDRDTVGTFPVIKSYEWAKVYAVPSQSFTPDPTLKYRIVIDLTVGPKNPQDTAGFTETNWGFGEIGRRLNLHVANNIPQKNIDIVVAIHGFAVFSMMNNEAYMKKYGIENPSLALIDELKKAGVKMIVCGQAMHHRHVNPPDLIPATTIGLTAQTVLTSYSAKGYSVQRISPENE